VLKQLIGFKFSQALANQLLATDSAAIAHFIMEFFSR
jgi:hypothetical protein